MTNSSPLPACHHRGAELDANRYECFCDRLLVPPIGVSAADCHDCPFANCHGGPPDDLAPDADRFAYVAPLGTKGAPDQWTGRLVKKPWRYRVTAVIPHLDTIEPLKLVIALLRLQTARPYILVIDTGSPPEVCAELETLRGADLEIHSIRAHGYIHSSGAVAAALDLSFALCRTKYLYSTHADVFLRRRDFLTWLLERCDERCPVVGYQMSDRSWATDEWRETVSHTATMLHMPTLRRIGASWSFERYYEAVGVPAERTMGWPDTESGFGLCLRQAGIKPLLIGPEVNFQRQTDDNIDHARSYPGSKLFGSSHLEVAEDYMALAMAEARQRIAAWS